MSASRIGTINPLGKSRVYTDETLKVVSAGSAEAAFVWKRGDLKRLKDRRHELGLDKNDEALRAAIASRGATIPSIERRIAELQAQLEALNEDLGKAAKSQSTTSSVDASDAVKALMDSNNRDALNALGEDEGIKDAANYADKRSLAEAIAAKRAAN